MVKVMDYIMTKPKIEIKNISRSYSKNVETDNQIVLVKSTIKIRPGYHLKKSTFLYNPFHFILVEIVFETLLVLTC